MTAKTFGAPAFPLAPAIDQAFNQSALKDYGEDELAQLLGVSPRWLQYQRQRGLPPPFYSPNRSNMIRYPHEALMDWKRGEVERSMAEARVSYQARKSTKAEPKSHKAKRSDTGSDHVMGVRLGPADVHGLDEPAVRGGRPRRMPATFASFLTSKDPGDSWLFTLRGVVQRPVDFLGMMVEGVERQANEELVWLTLAEWSDAMAAALQAEEEKKRAEHRHAQLLARSASPGVGRSKPRA